MPGAEGTSSPTCDMSLVVIDRVEDSEYEDQTDFNADMNVTLRGSNSNINTTEFPLLGDAIAAGSSKKKGWPGQAAGPQGRKNPPCADAQHTVLPQNLVATLDIDLEKGKDGRDIDRGRKTDASPPSIRHRSKSRGPKKDQAAKSTRKKIDKSSRTQSLSCNNRPLGVSDFTTSLQ